MELFKLFGRVLVETSDADRSLDKTDGKAKSLTENLGAAVKSAAGWAVAVGTAVVAAGTAIANIVSDVAASGDEIDKQSQKLGWSAQAYQEWAYILEHNGTSLSAVSSAIKTLNKNVGSASEETLAALEQIGIGTNEALTATPEELWEMVILHLQQMAPGTERTALMTKLFGESASELEPLLNSGAEATQDLKDKIHSLGGVMSDTLVSKSAEYEDAVTDLKIAWQGFKFDLAENTIPGMIKVVNGFTLMLTGDFIPGLKSMGIGIVEFFDGVAQTIAEKLGFGDGQGIADLMASEDFVSGLKAQYSASQNSQRPGKFAIGLPFVPRDNYPSLLHYGERVLTRQEAEEYNRGTPGGGFNQTVNIFTASQSPAQTAAAIRTAFETARWKI